MNDSLSSKPIADLLKYLRACAQVAEENGRNIAGVDTALTRQAVEEIERLQNALTSYELDRNRLAIENVGLKQRLDRLTHEPSEATVTRLPVPGSYLAPISDRVDDLIREMRRQGMETLRAAFDGMRLYIEPEESEVLAHQSPLAVALGKLSRVMGNPALRVGKHETLESALLDEARRRFEERAAQPPSARTLLAQFMSGHSTSAEGVRVLQRFVEWCAIAPETKEARREKNRERYADLGVLPTERPRETSAIQCNFCWYLNEPKAIQHNRCSSCGEPMGDDVSRRAK